MYLFPSKYFFRIQTALYDCIIPELDTMNPDYIEQFGIHSTGDPKLDKALERRTMRTKINILTMSYYNKMGITVTVIGAKHRAYVHNLIQSYLSEWNAFIQTEINIDPKIFSDFLRDLQSLSVALYNTLPLEVINGELEEKYRSGMAFKSVLHDSGPVIDRFDISSRQTYEEKYGSIMKLIHQK